MEEKRFQDCNWLVKLWRYRFYIPVPFKYLWFMYFKSFDVIETEFDEDEGCIKDTGETYNPRGKNLWSLLIGTVQMDMKWYYTNDEVFGRLKDRFPELEEDGDE